jgi:acyl-CoA ligase (AMP-forming) (exosortase A-associated)
MERVHDLLHGTAEELPDLPALTFANENLSYSTVSHKISAFARGLIALGLGRSERVGIFLDKRPETVVAAFAACHAGAVFVPINPLLKPEQVAYILRDCNVRVLVTSPERLSLLTTCLSACKDLRHVVLTSEPARPAVDEVTVHAWADLLDAPDRGCHRVIDADMAAILYTSGSTGKPKGVVLSHRNLVAGARSVASYLQNNRSDTLLAVLPLSFDAGFSQLTTAFCAGARVVLINYLVPKDVINALVNERVTGLTAVPPLYIQLSQLNWPSSIDGHLRYFANTGGRMPLETLKALRSKVPRARPYLMYGLTEAFRSTYLPPEEVDRRPDSIGKAIPGAEILVLRDDGTACAPNEPGELVHRGALVAMGYWNDPEKTAERYKPLPGREPGLVLPEIAVFSGDNVRIDEEGFLYFIARRDEMIKSSGYRISPTEIEEVLYDTQMLGEVAAFGVPHPSLGQCIVVVATPKAKVMVTEPILLSVCRERLPAFMVPAKVEIRDGPLPRNPNGKIDRQGLSTEFADMFTSLR